MNKTKLIDFDDLDEYLGVRQYQLIEYCLNSDFPGYLEKWPAAHPIWDCYLPGYKSPRDAWKDEECIAKAVHNLYYILDKSIRENKYLDFVESHKKDFDTVVFNNGYIVASDKRLLVDVLKRFTIAKIAPKVTALRKEDMLRIIDQTGYDLSSGVMCPMSGFGGIVEASKQWFINHNLDYTDKIESYDINKTFVDYYHFTGVRDLLAQHVKTDKTVIVCPPFGKKYEHWKGTPDEMSDISFTQWYHYIKEYIDAPQYIIIGPEINGKTKKDGTRMCGLFYKKLGIQLWTDEMVKEAEKAE